MSAVWWAALGAFLRMEIVGQIVLTGLNNSSRFIGPTCHKWYTGIIEEGRRFTLTDANNSTHHGFSSLEAAQSATGSIAIVRPEPTDAARSAERSRSRNTLLRLPIVSAAALLTSGGFTIAMVGASDFMSR